MLLNSLGSLARVGREFGRRIAPTLRKRSAAMRQTLATVSLTLALLIACFPQNGPAKPGVIRGEVVTKTRDGEPAVLPDARIVLHGPMNKETRSDAQGAFAIDGLPPGMYEIEASAPGLIATLVVEVKPGESSPAPMELNVATVTSTVTVNAGDVSLAEESAQKNTISQSTVEKAPNPNERIESLLPLVPGVVRGPDGRINMKGAQSTQAGWLMNSANVTDPATGDQGLRLPIDVVSC
jgi:hypothetical protein